MTKVATEVKRYMSPRQIEEAMGLPAHIVRRLIHAGKVKYIREGHTFYVDTDSLHEVRETMQEES